MNKKQWENSRGVTERIYIKGELSLKTPTHFGNGDTSKITDIPLLRDELDPTVPLLTGTSIAGALRNYLREFECGYGFGETGMGSIRAEQLFGYVEDASANDEGSEGSIQSWLMVDDAFGEIPKNGPPVEIRDGVVIESKSRTAEEGKKFDIELLPAGTTFELKLEFWLNESNENLLESLAIALKGFEKGDIRLGMRKRRGYGQCKVIKWQVNRYKMTEADGIIGWLTHSDETEGVTHSDIFELLGVSLEMQHQGESFSIEATFQIADSLLIRSDYSDTSPETNNGYLADTIHLKSFRNGGAQPILSGTSLAGVIRSRAYKIVNTLKGEDFADEITNNMFGKRIFSAKDIPSGSRVIIKEAEIKNGITNLIQNRIKIDRFTGGAYPGALFSEQPLFGKSEQKTQVTIDIKLLKTKNANKFKAEVGLLLMVLKDLWTGDLPVGGGSSVGRGRLKGVKATLKHGDKIWQIKEENGKLVFSGDNKPEELENQYVRFLLEDVK